MLDAVPDILGDIAHHTVGMLLIVLVIRFQGYGVVNHPQEICADVKVVAVVVSRRHNLYILLPTVGLGSMEGHAHGARCEPVQVVALGMACLWEHNDGEARIDALSHDVERFEIALQTFCTLPSEAEGRQQADPVEESCEHRVHGEHVRPRQCTDMLSKRQ